MSAPARLAIAIVVIAVLATGAWWLGPRQNRQSGVGPVPAADDDVLYWYDPMRPEVHFDKPGRSPFMDMELVAKPRGSAGGGSVAIDPRTLQNLGVRTAAAVQADMAPAVTATGTVAVNERRIAIITTRAGGWLERLDVRAVGDKVRRGQRIGGLYSPDLLAAQEEYLLAIRSDDQLLIPAARRRLELLGIGRSQLDRLVRSGSVERQADILAPANGVVTDLLVREGGAVASGMPIMNLADLSEVWVIAEVPESQGSWLASGQDVQMTVANADAQPIQGRLDYVYPEVAAATRTIRVRIVVPNESGTLRPGMSARVTLQGPSRSVVLVPTAALVRSGERTAVILAEGGGQFRPAAVVAGAEQGDQTEIRSGLQAGDRVVVSGQFLIDSEANLRGVLDRLQPGDAP
jgi:Cu(I)/Ag(I) efflux system membrane fusion protein